MVYMESLPVWCEELSKPVDWAICPDSQVLAIKEAVANVFRSYGITVPYEELQGFVSSSSFLLDPVPGVTYLNVNGGRNYIFHHGTRMFIVTFYCPPMSSGGTIRAYLADN